MVHTPSRLTPSTGHSGQGIRQRRKARGISLIECCITLAILSLLLGSGLNGLSDWIQRQRMAGQSQELIGDLMHMRSFSISRNIDMKMSFGTGASGSCYVVHTASAGSCSCDGTGKVQCDETSGDVLVSRHWPTSQEFSIQSNVKAIQFDPRAGIASPGGTVKLQQKNGVREIRHVVSLRGRVRTCSPLNDGLGNARC